MAGGLFGGVAEGIQTGLKLQSDAAKREKSGKAAEALTSYREGMLNLNKRRTEVQERRLDLTLAERMRQVLSDANLHPEARSFLLDEIITSLGHDPASDRYKRLKNVIIKMPVDQAQGLSEALVTALPSSKPGQIRQVIEGLLKGGISPTDIPKMMMEFQQQAGRAEAFGNQQPQGAPQSSPAADEELPPIPTQERADIEAAREPEAPDAEPMDKEAQVRDLRSKARMLGSRGDMEGMRAALQMARDIEGKSGTNINFITEREEAKNLSKRDYGKIEALDKEADSARALESSLKAFEIALDGKRFAPGSFGGTRLALSQMAEFVGLNPESEGFKALGLGDTASGEVMQAASNRLGLDMADKMSRMTNMSLNFVKEAVPNLVRTDDGNRLIIEMIRAGNRRTLEVQNMAEEFLTNHGTLRPPGKRSYFQERNDLMEKPLFDDAFVNKVKEASRKGSVVDLSKAKSKAFGTSENGQVTLGDGRRYKSVGTTPDGMTIVETQGPLGKTGRFPVVDSTEQWDELAPGETVIWGPTGEIIVKRQAQ